MKNSEINLFSSVLNKGCGPVVVFLNNTTGYFNI